MPIVSDFTKVSKQIVLDLINFDNQSSLTASDIAFGIPAVNTDPTPPRNTKLTVTAEPNSGLAGSVEVQYDRVNLSLLAGTMSKEFSVGNATMISDIIPEINARYHVNLAADDYVDASLPAFAGEPNEILPVDVVAKAGSLVWIGTYQFNLRAEDIPLSMAITTTTLNGLNYVPYVDPNGIDIGGIGYANGVGFFEEMIPFTPA